jgi:hypothetical protein
MWPGSIPRLTARETNHSKQELKERITAGVNRYPVIIDLETGRFFRTFHTRKWDARLWRAAVR